MTLPVFDQRVTMCVLHNDQVLDILAAVDNMIQYSLFVHGEMLIIFILPYINAYIHTYIHTYIQQIENYTRTKMDQY